jgi:low affinity Fe/Cu permease
MARGLPVRLRMGQREIDWKTREKHHLEIGQKLPAKGFGHWFSRFASQAADATGSHWAFLIVVVLILSWTLTGPIFNFSDSWQLIANTVTTLGTTLMVFLIQNTQNRDSRAIHLKLDELLRAVPRARKELMEAEEEDIDEIEREKAIVDRADPAPPEDRAPGHQVHNGHPKAER